MPPLKLHTGKTMDLYSADTESALALPVVVGKDLVKGHDE